MRLWHEALIPFLPRAQLLGQHRECCALRGKGWGKKHATVNYVFHYPYEMLYQYHLKVMLEMHRRGYKTDPLWHRLDYRGKLERPYTSNTLENRPEIYPSTWIYPEHDSLYLQECLANLDRKGIRISINT